MRDIFTTLDHWLAQSKPIALATVIQTWGSAPRGVGAKMALTANNEITGSVSGGCVEGAVYEAGVETLTTRRPQLLHFGVADDTAWEVGLACGGTIEVFVHPLEPSFYTAVRQTVVEDRLAAIVTVIRAAGEALGRTVLVRDDGSWHGTLGAELDEAGLREARRALTEGRSQRVTLSESVELFIEVSWPAPTLIVVGGVHITVALVALAKTLGYRTIVIDPRSAFGSETRFAHADRLIQKWPDEALAEIPLTRSTAVAMLTHDPKLDDPALKLALPSAAFYVGALGSRTTQEKRRARLLADGLTEAQLNRLAGPIGLDLGAKTPEEIALSVMAEIVATRNGKRE